MINKVKWNYFHTAVLYSLTLKKAIMHTDRDYLLEILTALTSHDVEFIVWGT